MSISESLYPSATFPDIHLIFLSRLRMIRHSWPAMLLGRHRLEFSNYATRPAHRLDGPQTVEII
jgi:hypothetical protein